MTDYAKTAKIHGGRAARWLNVAKRTKGAATFTFYLAWDNTTKKATINLRKLNEDPLGKKVMKDSANERDRASVGVPPKAKALRGFVDGDSEGSGVILTVIEDLKISNDAKGAVARGQRIIKKLGEDYGDIGFLQNNAEVRLLSLEEYEAERTHGADAQVILQKVARDDRAELAKLGLSQRDILELQSTKDILTGLASSPRWIDSPETMRDKRVARVEAMLTKLGEDGLDDELIEVLTDEVFLLASRMPVENDRQQTIQRLQQLIGLAPVVHGGDDDDDGTDDDDDDDDDESESHDDGGDDEGTDDEGDDDDDDDAPPPPAPAPPAAAPALFDPDNVQVDVQPLNGAAGILLLYMAGMDPQTLLQANQMSGFTNIHLQWGENQTECTGTRPDPNGSYAPDQLVVLMGPAPPGAAAPPAPAPAPAPAAAADDDDDDGRPDWWDEKKAIVDEYDEWLHDSLVQVVDDEVDRSNRTVGALGYTADLTHTVSDDLTERMNTQVLDFLEGVLGERIEEGWTRPADCTRPHAADLAERIGRLLDLRARGANTNLRLFGDLLQATTWHDWQENEIQTEGDYDRWFKLNAVQPVINGGGRFVFNLQGFTQARTTQLRGYGETIPRRLLNLQVGEEDERSLGGVDIPKLTRTEYEVIAVLWDQNIYDHTRWYTFNKMTDTDVTELDATELPAWGLHSTIAEAAYAAWLAAHHANDPWTALRAKMLAESGAPDLLGVLDDWEDVARPKAKRFLADDITPLWEDAELMSSLFVLRYKAPPLDETNKIAFAKYWIEVLTGDPQDWDGEWKEIVESVADEAVSLAPDDIAAFKEIHDSLTTSYSKHSELP